MKIQIRKSVFETNSSSTHAISIIKDSAVTEYPTSIEFGMGYFGWEIDNYNTTSEKAAYIWESIRSNSYKDENFVQNSVNKITEILAKYGIEAIFPFNHPNTTHSSYKVGDEIREYTYTDYLNEEGEKDDGYVDHGDETYYFLIDIMEDETKLLNFLFDNKSYIATGNDNDGDIGDCPDNGPAWEYDKGN